MAGGGSINCFSIHLNPLKIFCCVLLCISFFKKEYTPKNKREGQNPRDLEPGQLRKWVIRPYLVYGWPLVLQPQGCHSVKSVLGMCDTPEVSSIPRLKGQVYWEILYGLFPSLLVSFQ